METYPKQDAAGNNPFRDQSNAAPIQQQNPGFNPGPASNVP